MALFLCLTTNNLDCFTQQYSSASKRRNCSRSNHRHHKPIINRQKCHREGSPSRRNHSKCCFSKFRRCCTFCYWHHTCGSRDWPRNTPLTLEQQSSWFLLKDQTDYLLEFFNQVLLGVLYQLQFCGTSEYPKVGWRVFGHRYICSDTSFGVWIGLLCCVCAFPKRFETTRHNTLKTEDRKPLLKLNHFIIANSKNSPWIAKDWLKFRRVINCVRHKYSFKGFVRSRFLYLAIFYSYPYSHLLKK